jgi:hypothetical protein
MKLEDYISPINKCHHHQNKDKCKMSYTWAAVWAYGWLVPPMVMWVVIILWTLADMVRGISGKKNTML